MSGMRSPKRNEVGGRLSSLALPILTKRLVLRLPTLADTDSFMSEAHDPRLLQWFSKGSPPETREEQIDTIRKIRKAARAGDSLSPGLFDRGSGASVGVISLSSLNWGDMCAEIGYIVSPNHWGKGYATEAVAMLCAEAFGCLNLHRIEAQVWPSNLASGRVLEKVGFHKEGTRRQCDLKGKTWLDCDTYGLLRGENRLGPT